MNVLQLIIKQKFFDEILAGKKTQEFREIRPKTSKKYINYVCNGKEYKNVDDITEDGEIDVVPVQYDAIRFFVGYHTNRASALVEVTGSTVEFLVDEDGNDIVYEYEGEEYLMAQMVYDLGKILEKNV